MPSLDALFPLGEAHREPLREQLRRGAAAPERHHRAARVAGFREHPGPCAEWAQARAARRAQLHAAARALLREHGRRRPADEGDDRNPRARLWLARSLARGVQGDGIRARRRLGLGAAHLYPARRPPHQPVRRRALAVRREWRADPGARHVRARLSHGLRRQRQGLRRYVPAQRGLASAGAALRRRGQSSRAPAARTAGVRRHPGHRRGGSERHDGRRQARAGHRRAPAGVRLAGAGYRGRRSVARSRAAPAMDRRALEVRTGGRVLRVRFPRRLQDGNQASRGRLRREVHEQRPLRLEGERRSRENTAVIRRILAARALRSFADGFIAVVLPAYLLALGLGQLEVGVISTSTLLGSALATLAIGRWGNRFSIRRLLLGAALLMAVTGLGFAGFTSFWPLLVVAFVGTLNPSSGDASIFMPLDHTVLANPPDRPGAFARYSFIGSMAGALGALAAALPEALGARIAMVDALRLMFVLYAAVGMAAWALYLRLPEVRAADEQPTAPLGPSRLIVWRLAALFSVDSLAGGLILNSLLALWLFERYSMSLAAAGAFFFWTGLLSACSQLVAAPLARRIGMINTMVFTHIPSSLFLIGAALATNLEVALACLLARSLLSQMDVPARGAFVMSVVTPAERPAAASFTALPRSLAAAISPSITAP